MYAALWRLLPGRLWLKVVEALLLAVAVSAALLLWGFPAIEPHLPFDRIIIGEE